MSEPFVPQGELKLRPPKEATQDPTCKTGMWGTQDRMAASMKAGGFYGRGGEEDLSEVCGRAGDGSVARGGHYTGEK
jgi:hypothetical protein